MEVESSGVAKKDTPKNKILVIILGIFGALIIGLVIAIIVVKNLPKGGEVATSALDPTLVNVAYDTYEATRDQIMSDILNKELSSLEVLELYKTYIEESQDEVVKAFLTTDYYEEIMAQDIELSKGGEVIDGLIGVDKILNNAASAMAVWNAAEYYNIKDVSSQYKSIAEGRLGNDTELEHIE